MSEEDTRTARDFVAALLSVPDPRDRLRRVRQYEDHFDADLVEEIRRSAASVMRRDPREAGVRAQLALVVAEAIRSPRERALCLIQRAKAAVLCGTAAVALESADQASRLARELADAALESEADLLRIQAQTALERYDEARACGERVLSAFEERKDSPGQVRAHTALADLDFRVDRPRAALRHYTQAERLLPAAPAPQVLGVLALNRANALDACNRFRAASRHFDRARELFRAAGCEHTVAQVEYNAAYGEFLRGRYQDALRRYAVCEDAFRLLEDALHLAHIDLDRAEIHLHLGLPTEAAGFAASAERRFQALRLVKEQAQAVFLHACAAEQRGHAHTAMVGLERAEQLFRELGLGERAARCVVARAGLAARAGDAPAARRLAVVARDLLGGDVNPLSRATLELLLAQLDLGAGERAAAASRAEAVLDTCERIHAPPLRIETLRLLGRARFELGERDLAIAAYGAAADELERFRGGVPPDEYMAAFLGGRTALYEEAVETHVVAGEVAIAFEYAERSKSRALVDMLAGRRRDGPIRRDEGPLARRLSYLRERLHVVYEQLSRRELACDVRPTRFVEETRERAKRLEDEVAALLRRRRVEDRRAASLDAVDVRDAHELRARLEPGEAIVEYLFTANALYAFVVTADEIHAVRRETLPGEVAHLVDRCRFHVSRGREGHERASHPILCTTRADLANLGDLLLQPIAPWLVDVRRMIVVPQGVLHHVPFHALPWRDGWLSDDFEVVYAPSAAVYGLCRASRATAKGAPAVFGLPDVFAEEIENECRNVADVLGDANLYLRDEATFERVREEVGRARIVHIATHGMFRRAHPMLSSIRLADRWVNLYDLYDLTVRSELVVLSSCESGTADTDHANELLGLTRGLLYAGAPAVLTSQWRVDDAVTTTFMECFHRELRDVGDAAAAHRRAMATIRRQHPHPYFWAPFFLTGCPVDGRRRSLQEDDGAETSEEPR